MLFNSFDFAIFLPIVFIIYWFFISKNVKYQNILIVISSYIFYGWWDYRFLSLIFFSTIIDYCVGLRLMNQVNPKKRKLLLILSIVINIGFLAFFKYFNFFINNFIEAFSFFGYKFNPLSIKIILPVGISFYTFQTMSYSIDVYRKKLEPTRDFIAFAAYVSFFPQLVAGPIERATNLLPQFIKNREFKYEKAVDGMRQILWGFFKKLVIADNCAEYVNYIFSNSQHLPGSALALGAILFAFQIYGDFSGYSDIAIGVAKLFGFELMQNFAFPYFSRDIAEFWRRWHISLSTWFRDYVYIPLGGSKVSTSKVIRNTFIIFVVSGFWHGPNWTFIVWGLLNALFFIPLLITGKNRRNMHIIPGEFNLKGIIDFFRMIVTFIITCFAWIFFRAESISHANNIIIKIFSNSLFVKITDKYFDKIQILIILLLFFVFIEWIGRRGKYALERLDHVKSKFLRWTIYSFIIFLIGMYMQTNETPFIYFQF